MFRKRNVEPWQQRLKELEMRWWVVSLGNIFWKYFITKNYLMANHIMIRLLAF